MKKEIINIINKNLPKDVLVDMLHQYHENDIAQCFDQITKDQMIYLYEALGAKQFSEIISFVDEPQKYINELGVQRLAAIINEMDSDDAVDFLENIDENTKDKLRVILKDEVREDILLINSYQDDEIGSLITTNYIEIKNGLTIKQATHELIKQAGTNDNISTLYVVNDEGRYCGAIDLKDLIVARSDAKLEDLIMHSYPYILDHEKIAENIERLKDYAEDSLPVLNSNFEIIGILTAQDLVEAIDDELGEDYAKLSLIHI